MKAVSQESSSTSHVHSWLREIHVALVPGPMTPLLEGAAENLLRQFDRLGHGVQSQPGDRTDVVLTTARFGEPIGLLTIAITRIVAPQAQVTAMARYPQQVEMAWQLGASEVVTGGDAYEEVARITDGQLYTGSLGNRMLLGGFDIVYDIVGSGRTIQDSLRWAKAGGAVVVVGVVPKVLKTDLSPVWHQEVTLAGSVVHGMEEWEGQRVHGYELVARWMLEGALPTEGLITHRYPLAEYKQAVATATDKRTGAIKVVLQME